MPYAFVFHRGHPAADKVMHALPEAVAQAISVAAHLPHDGLVRPEDIFVVPLPAPSINGKDIEVLVLAHPYPERVRNIEERKEQIIAALRRVLKDDRPVSCAVAIGLIPLAFGIV